MVRAAIGRLAAALAAALAALPLVATDAAAREGFSRRHGDGLHRSAGWRGGLRHSVRPRLVFRAHEAWRRRAFLDRRRFYGFGAPFDPLPLYGFGGPGLLGREVDRADNPAPVQAGPEATTRLGIAPSPVAPPTLTIIDATPRGRPRRAAVYAYTEEGWTGDAAARSSAPRVVRVQVPRGY